MGHSIGHRQTVHRFTHFDRLITVGRLCAQAARPFFLPVRAQEIGENDLLTAHNNIAETTTDAFILTRRYRETASGLELEFWACSPRGPVKILVAGQEAVCFVEQSANVDGGEFGIARIGDVELKMFSGVPVKVP